jgi:hypothetical protein
MPMSASQRFLEIAYLQALLHYTPDFRHKPSYHPVRAIPSQNPVQFRNRRRFHAGRVPKSTDRWSEERDRVNNHFRKSCWRLPTDALSLTGDSLSPAVGMSGIDRHRRERHKVSASEREAGN